MTNAGKGMFDGLVDTIEHLAKEMGISDLVEKLDSKVKTEEADVETVSRKEYGVLRQAYARLEQEIEGYKARLRREHQQSVYRAESNALESSFKALDALEGALQYLESSELDSEVRKHIAAGIELQRDATLAYLAKTYKVNPLPSVGSQANPQYHHVVSEIPSEQPKGTIIAVIRVGYTRNGELIREAMVAVAKEK